MKAYSFFASSNLVILFLLFLTACERGAEPGFAMYLVAPEIPDPRIVDASKLREIPSDKDPLIQEHDILSYDLKNHRMRLTEEAFDRVNKLNSLLVDVDGMPFVILVSADRIYSGAFYTPAFSISYDGVVVLQPNESEAHTISFILGYPDPIEFTHADPRYDPRIVERFREIDKLLTE